MQQDYWRVDSEWEPTNGQTPKGLGWLKASHWPEMKADLGLKVSTTSPMQAFQSHLKGLFETKTGIEVYARHWRPL